MVNMATGGSPPPELWKYFVDVQLWPKRAKFDPQGWLENFSGDEVPLAKRLLEGFTYYATELVEQMFKSAFLNISQIVVDERLNFPLAQAQWTSFISSLMVVRVTGEVPSDADSGFIFSRLTREILTIDERQILSPEEALAKLTSSGAANVLFVDDFVGSGNQFTETWARVYNTPAGALSFQAIAHMHPGLSFFYLPVICTEHGRGHISRHCPRIKIVPAHFLDPDQSALSANSVIWRDDMRAEGPAFVEAASLRAGIPDLGGHVGCWRGFHKLGLTLAFSHGWPDATLPLFSWNRNGWKPLLRKAAI